MIIGSECIPCILNMGLRLAQQVLRHEARVMSFMKGITNAKFFGDKNARVTSAQVVQDIWSRLIKVARDEDPLKAVKEEQNNAALTFYPLMKERVTKSRDPVAEAVRFAIIGNSLDAMRDALLKRPEETFQSLAKSKTNRADVEVFKDRLQAARKILYFADNCGEIVFDRVLIEAIQKAYAPDMVLVVRSTPTLNDATLADSKSVGLDRVVPVIENGIIEPLPGTELKKVSPRLRKLISEADLLIAKGGGNHDSMTEEAAVRGKTTFLFQAKCRPYSNLYNTPQNGLIVYNG